MKKYDVIIVGGGVAALSAAIYTARKELSTLIIAKEVGGQTAWAADIENYPGYEKIKGVELILKMKKQVENLKVVIKEGEFVKGISGKAKSFIVTSSVAKYNCQSIIIASGKMPRKLGVPGEEEFVGRGVAYCATCDAPLFRDKVVAVIGGGNSALDAASELSQYAKKVYILVRSDSLRADPAFLEAIKKDKKIEIILNAVPKKITGEQFVSELFYSDAKTKKEKSLKTDGIFIEIGYSASTDFIPTNLKRNKLNEVIIDHKTGATNVSGIFAAGDVTDCIYKQAVISAGSAATSALSVYEYLKK